MMTAHADDGVRNDRSAPVWRRLRWILVASVIGFWFLLSRYANAVFPQTWVPILGLLCFVTAAASVTTEAVLRIRGRAPGPSRGLRADPHPDHSG